VVECRQDNFAHDVVRYSTETHQPFQCHVSVDSTGDYTELYEPVTDPLITRYLSLRARTPTPRSPALSPAMDASPLLRKIWSLMPFAPNLTKPEFVPTKQLMLLDVLRDKFPRHRLLMSDFSSLPDAIPGEMAPVVQTRYEGEVSWASRRVWGLWLREEVLIGALFSLVADCGVHDLSGSARLLRHLLPDRLPPHARHVQARYGR